MDNTMQGTNSTPTAKGNPSNGFIGEAAMGAHVAVDKAATVAGSAVKSVSSAIDESAASGHQAISKLEDKAKPAEQWINEKTDALLAAPKNAVSDARQFVVTHPWQSVAVALFAGMLLGRKKS